MNIYFVDSSALVKRYNREQGSHWMDDLLAENVVQVSPITPAEVIAALARTGKAGKAARTLSGRQVDYFHEDVDDGIIAIVRPVMELFDRAAELATAGDLRGCDAVQLAAALRIKDELQRAEVDAGVIFVCSDVALNDVAISLGFTAQNPAEEEKT